MSKNHNPYLSKKMRLMKMTGGLGNQMFIYAFYLQMRHRFADTRIDISDICNKHEHNGFELNDIFELDAQYVHWPAWFKKMAKFLFFKEIDERKEDIATTGVFKRNFSWPFIYYKGFYQSELFFKDVEAEVRAAFRFNRDKANNYSREIAKEIQADAHAVSFHVRRGDYFKPKFFKRFGSVCPTSYYQQAAEKILALDPQAHFYLFSDDTEWVKENLQLPNVTIVNGNRGKDSWQDMMLMSLCRYHVIPNSTFSWWGAWLDDRKDKVVITPQKWFGDCDLPYIIPEGWTKIAGDQA